MKTINLIIIAMLFTFPTLSQVGINTESPSQTLDVNGKIEVGDDETSPTEGAIRFNNSNMDFEGHNGSNWQSFTESGTSPLPSKPIPIYARVNGLLAGDFNYATFRDWETSSNFDTPTEGKYLIITGVYPSSNNTTSNDYFYFLSMGIDGNFNSSIHITSTLHSKSDLQGDQAPLFVLKPGQRFSVYSGVTSAAIMDVYLRGFLVDDLSY